MSTPTPPPWAQEQPWTQQQPSGQQQWGSPPTPPAAPPLEPSQRQPWGNGKKAAVGIGGLLVVGLIWGQVNPAPKTPLATASTTATAEAKPESSSAKESSAEGEEPVKASKPKATKAPTIKFETVTAREWKKIAKNPDAHIGEAIVLYGYVTQADGSTGDEYVRANADAVRHRGEYGYLDYDTNTILTAGKADFSDLVEDDVFRIKAVVVGKLDYETALGGETSAPVLTVEALSILESTK